MGNQHTPGPWKVMGGARKSDFPGATVNEYWIDARPDGVPGRVHSVARGIDVKEDADVMATGPDMLAAIKEFVDYYTPKPHLLGNGRAAKMLRVFQKLVVQAEGGSSG